MLNDQAISALRDEDVERRLKAVETLGLTRDPRHLDHLIAALGDNEWRVRKTSVAMLLQFEHSVSLVDRLISVLRQERNVGKKNSVLEVLIGIGSRTVIPVIQELQRSSDPDLQKFLIEVLGEIGDQQSTPVLLGMLDSPDENVQMAAAESLGKLKDARSVDRLITVMEGDNPLVSFSAVKALEKIGDARAVGPLISAVQRKPLERCALEVLGKIGDARAMAVLLSAVTRESAKTRSSAVKGLRDLSTRLAGPDQDRLRARFKQGCSSETAAFLIEALSEPDERLQEAAISLLGWIEDPRAAEPLVRFLDGRFRDPTVQSLVTIGRAAGPQVIETLVQRVSNLNEGAREGVARVLGEIADRGAVPALIHLLSDSNGHVRQTAAWSLGRIGDPAAGPALLQLLVDPYQSVQEMAVQAMGRLSTSALEGPLLALLSGTHIQGRCNAAKLLGRSGRPQAIPHLALALKDADSTVRKAAVEALGGLNIPDVDEWLILSLADEDYEVRLKALSFVVKSDRIPVVGHLEPMLSDDSIWVRTAAVKGLGRWGSQSPSVTADQKEQIRSLLHRSLSDRVGVVQIAAIEALSGIEGPAVAPSLRGLLESHDTEVVKAAIQALGKLGDQSSGPNLERFLSHEHWSIRAETAQALGLLGVKTVRPRLETLVHKDPDPLVQRAAQSALEKLI